MKRWIPLILLVAIAIWWSTTGFEWGDTPSRPDESGVTPEEGRPEPAPEVAEDPTTEPSDAPEAAEPEKPWVPDPNGRPIAGWVVDENEEPVAGAVVRFGSRAWLRKDWEQLPAATTGEDGGFRLDGLSEGLYYLTIGAPLHIRASLDKVPAGRTDVRITLSRAGRIAVRIELPEGTTPPEAARVQTYIERRDERTGEWKHASLGFIEGLEPFHTQGLPAGRYRVKARLMSVGFGTSAEVEVRLGETTPVTVSPTGGETLAGRVVSDPTGKPVEGALVVAGLASEVPAIGQLDDDAAAFAMGAISTRTDAKGRFRIPGLVPGLHNVGACAEGLRPVTVEDIEIPREKDLVLRLGYGGTLEVLVLDREGKPVAQAGVSAEFDLAGFLSGETGERGICRLPVLPPGEVHLTAETPKWTVAGPATVVAGKTTRVTLRHPSGPASLAGSLTREGRAVVDRILSFEGKGFSLEAQTGPDGRYRLAGIPVGRIKMVVNDLRRLPVLEKFTEVRPGENTLDVDLPTGILRIRVLDDANDKPLPVVWVIFPSGRQTWTNGEGRVTIEDLEEGEHAVQVRRQGYEGRRLKVRTTGDAGEVVIRLTAKPK